LYSSVYDEWYQRVPSNPMRSQRQRAEYTRSYVASQLSFLRPVLRRDSTFLEIGAGDCALAFEVAKRVAKVYAIDASDEITRSARRPRNFELVISDGRSVPVPAGSVHVAYSNQLMEHLHPDAALEQVGNVYQAVAPGGSYVCVAPNRINGPHDISQYFDEVATGFHLKEYTNADSARCFGLRGSGPSQNTSEHAGSLCVAHGFSSSAGRSSFSDCRTACVDGSA
jgi:SAM-dependent methyltransferase